MIIDPPTPFAPLAEWQRFLAEMKRLAKTTPAASAQVAQAIALAEAAIAKAKG